MEQSYTDYNNDNWEPEFMTIFVTWQLIATLDSIRNSCDVLNDGFPYTVFVLQGGTYKTKEQIQKAPTDDHPCNLTRTSVTLTQNMIVIHCHLNHQVKISFPALKSETFVNLLGYKEPNLIHLWRW